jgi:hypothetical protein
MFYRAFKVYTAFNFNCLNCRFQNLLVMMMMIMILGAFKILSSVSKKTVEKKRNF